MKVDVAILGGGFAGSLTAMLLAQADVRVCLLDPSRHPRFRIGESSTPTADLMLRRLANQYQLPELTPLTRFGDWRETYPHVECGLKRGFSYFQHQPELPFRPSRTHERELIVAASSRDEVADTHWLRADVDHFLFQIAQRKCHFAEQGTVIDAVDRTDHRWTITARLEAECVQVKCDFLIDGSGASLQTASALNLSNDVSSLKTNSRALYSHFEDVQPFTKELEQLGASLEDYPFNADDAAQHHLLEEGWMWILRFVDGRSSVGIMLDERRPNRVDASAEPESQWRDIVGRYPSLENMLANARIAAQPGRMYASERLQRRVTRASGDNWALLPNTAGFVDPLHSTGIAHSVFGAARLASILEQHLGRESLPKQVGQYGKSVIREIDQIDRLVSGCYRAKNASFQRFVDFSMLYFIAAHRFEDRLAEPVDVTDVGDYLGADCREFVALLDEAEHRMDHDGESGVDFADWFVQAIAPYNSAGLCDAGKLNMYSNIVVE